MSEVIYKANFSEKMSTDIHEVPDLSLYDTETQEFITLSIAYAKKSKSDIVISRIRKKYEIIIVSGGCRGADTLGERYAKENGFKIERYPALWEKYGRSAGPKRNRQMAEISDYVICFWDGKSQGTKSMIMVIESRNSVYLHYFDTKSSIWSQIFNENLSMPIAMNIVKIKFSQI